MEDWVLSKVNTTHVVTIEKNWIRDGNTQILQCSFQPNDFTCGNYSALYSAYVLDSATVSYFLLLQDMAPLLREKKNPEC